MSDAYKLTDYLNDYKISLRSLHTAIHNQPTFPDYKNIASSDVQAHLYLSEDHQLKMRITGGVLDLMDLKKFISFLCDIKKELEW